MTNHICTTRPGHSYTCDCPIGHDHTRQERQDFNTEQLKGNN